MSDFLFFWIHFIAGCGVFFLCFAAAMIECNREELKPAAVGFVLLLYALGLWVTS